MLKEEGTGFLIAALRATRRTGSSQYVHQDGHGFISCAPAPCRMPRSEKDQHGCFYRTVGRASKHIVAWVKKSELLNKSYSILKPPQRHFPISIFSPVNTHVMQYHWGTTPNVTLTVGTSQRGRREWEWGVDEGISSYLQYSFNFQGERVYVPLNINGQNWWTLFEWCYIPRKSERNDLKIQKRKKIKR